MARAAAALVIHVCGAAQILIDRVREASVMTQLTEQGFGCPMIGAFANGRVEKFLQVPPHL